MDQLDALIAPTVVPSTAQAAASQPNKGFGHPPTNNASNRNKYTQKKPPPWKQHQKPVSDDSAKRPKMGSRTAESTVKIKPIKTWHSVFSTNIGLESVVEAVFSFMKAQSPKLLITLPQMQYVTCLAFWNRLVQLGLQIGKIDQNPPETYELNALSQGIKLPAILVRYITSFGEVTLPSGAKIIPAIPEFSGYDPHYVYPRHFWCLGHPGQEPPAGYWTIDVNWITQWNENCSKGGKTDFGLGTVDFRNTIGTDHLVVSYLRSDTTVRPLAPYDLTHPEAELGAAFQYRDYADYNVWPGVGAEMVYATFEAPPIFIREVISRVCGQLSKDLWAVRAK